MSKKNKNKPQKNLSLRERLEKHWNNKNWGAFVSLFMRDKTASNATTMGGNLHSGLYELMTESLFLNKDFDATKEAAAIILREPDGETSKINEIKQCAQIALSFLKMREGEEISLLTEPAKNSQNLPRRYALLSDGLRTAMQETDKDNPIIKKFTKQMGELDGKKGLTAYTNWLKTAQELEKNADSESAQIFKAISAIVSIIRELNRAERGSGHAMRDIDNVRGFKSFDNVIKCRNHPLVSGLWEFFCRDGETKFGEDWGKSARVLLRYEKYEHLLKVDDWCEILRTATKSEVLTEQEMYLIKTLYVKNFFDNFFLDFEFFESLKQLKTSLEDLASTGTRWRTSTAWSKAIEKSFCKFIYGSGPLFRDVVDMVEDIRLPYESLSPVVVAALAVFRGGNVASIEKNVRAPMKLERNDFNDIVSVIAVYSTLVGELSPKIILGLERLFEKQTLEEFFTTFIQEIMIASSRSVFEGSRPDEQEWSLLKQNTLEKLGKILPKDSPEGCFCRLCAPQFSISKSPELTEALFSALRGDSQFGGLLFFVLETWNNVETSFVVRLFEHCREFHQKKAMEHSVHWEKIAESIAKIDNKQRRGLIAYGVLCTISRFKNKSSGLKRAISKLERIMK